MKTTILLTILALCCMQCEQFPTRFERIEPNKLRFINFTYQGHAEAAPGDTMRVRAYFAGAKTTSVTWQLSYDRITTQYGTDTVVNVRDLPVFDVANKLPDSIDFAFVVPDSTFFKTVAISQQSLSALKSRLPPGMAGMSQQQLAAFLKDLGDIDLNNPVTLPAFIGQWGPALGITTLDSASFEKLMMVGGMVVSFFSVRGELFAHATAENGDRLKIRSDFTIRYNSRFEDIPEISDKIPVNHNPEVRWVGVYTVENFTGQRFSPLDPAMQGKFTFAYIYNELFPWKVNDTITIEKGRSYFLAADSGTVSYELKAGDSIVLNGSVLKVPHDTTIIDSALDRRFMGIDSVTGKERFDYETYHFNWQYQPLSVDSVTLPLDSLFVISSGGGPGGTQPPIVQFLPSLDKKMTHARVWVSVYDYLFGEMFRPIGFTVRTVDLYFKYK